MTDPQLETPSGKKRARALGIPFDGTPGPLNAITDVAGVEVGTATVVFGEGPRTKGEGPARTGVTAIHPAGRANPTARHFAAMWSLNGWGELTGHHAVEETGGFEGPVVLTNTVSVGAAYDAVHRWYVARSGATMDSLPVVGETFDGHLNDIDGFHVTEAHVFEALDGAAAGPVEEGSVGGGTGMITYEFKGGNGTASRVAEIGDRRATVGAFVQSNFGSRHQLRIAGLPVGQALPGGLDDPPPAAKSSIVVIVATDAPLAPHQLKALARRAGLGIGRTGSTANHGSGDIFMAFSTANREAAGAAAGCHRVEVLANTLLDPLYKATVEAVEEAVINALVANETMTGADDNTVEALPHGPVIEMLRKHGRLAD